MAKACEFTDDSGWLIFCPACRCGHKFDKGRWTFNGDLEKPTFSPSMLVKSVDLPKHNPITDDFAKGEDGEYLFGPDGRLLGCKDRVCHSFVRDGHIEFLNDCTHELAGQTVDLPNI